MADTDVAETWRCIHGCGEQVRRVTPDDGIDSDDARFVHVGGGVFCDFTPVAWPAEDTPDVIEGDAGEVAAMARIEALRITGGRGTPDTCQHLARLVLAMTAGGTS